MTANMLDLLLRLHPPGQRVRFKDTPHARETFAKHGVPAAPDEGLVLQTLPDPAEPIFGGVIPDAFSVLVEFPKGNGWDMAAFKSDDLEVLPIDPDALEKELVGRIVHFARSSGIGIAFPAGAAELAVICAVRMDHGQARLTVAVDVEGRTTPFVTEADFTQCSLKVRGTQPR